MKACLLKSQLKKRLNKFTGGCCCVWLMMLRARYMWFSSSSISNPFFRLTVIVNWTHTLKKKLSPSSTAIQTAKWKFLQLADDVREGGSYSLLLFPSVIFSPVIFFFFAKTTRAVFTIGNGYRVLNSQNPAPQGAAVTMHLSRRLTWKSDRDEMPAYNGE